MADPRLKFEHRVIQPLKDLGGVWLLAVSGGVDSLVMAEALYRWARYLKIRLVVGHVHHGHGSNKQKRFRDRAQKITRGWCLERNIAFLTNTPERVTLATEAAMREYRLAQLRAWKLACKAQFVAFAHHQDDLLETRLIRLVRGTGPQGLKSMSARRGAVLRPMLGVSRREIEDYARARNLEFVEDPSNHETRALRNWMRQVWLPLLEQKRPGARQALARSLEILSAKEYAVLESKVDVGLRREWMKGCSPGERERIVAEYFARLGLKNYGQRHVREVLKRMDSRPKKPTFLMLGIVFELTEDQLRPIHS